MYINTDEEIWKDVKGYEGIFKISNTGKLIRVKNSPNMPDNNVLKGEVTKFGYRQYHMRLKGVSKRLKAHRLVAEAFIPNPNNLPQVNHIDGDKLNNNVKNLEWCDQKHNNRHALATGLREIDMQQVRNMHKTMAKKQQRKVNQLDLNGNLIKQFDSMNGAADYFGGHSSNIRRVCKGKGKTAFGYKWEYASPARY